MKSLILVCLALLVADSLGVQIPVRKTPTRFGLDPDRLPQNEAVVEGDTVILDCAVDPLDTDAYQIVWYEYVYNPLGGLISSNENIGQHPERARYSIIHDDPLRYSLMISPVVMADGGTYQCQDQMSTINEKRVHSLSLTVVAATVNCTSTLGASGVALEDSYHTNDCQLEYQGSIIPNMTWIGTVPFTQKYIATPTHIWVGMEFNAIRQMNGLAFQCKTDFSDYFLPLPGDNADNVPDYSRVDQSKQIFVQWGPKNLVVVPVKQRYDIGDILTCSADASPVPDYFWQNLRTNEMFNSNTFVVPDHWQGTNQTMRCDVRNTIEGSIYSQNIFQVLDVNPSTTTVPTTPTPPTTAPPAVSDCGDLTGGWRSSSPTNGLLCIKLDVENNGALRGLMLNESDTFWVDIVGRAQAEKFDQVGFNGIWPEEIGVSSFIGECHRCYGIEQLLVHVVNRAKGAQCGTGGDILYTSQYTFYRSFEEYCPNLPIINPNERIA